MSSAPADEGADLAPPSDPAFAAAVIAWQRRHGRHDLPWQDGHDAYRVWLSEIMLQQTQVATVIPYYQRFTTRFPDVAALAAAAEDEVLALWSGLGYYARARNLHRAAGAVVRDHGGAFPADPVALARLPGIGRSTAAAIAVFVFGRQAAILDGNVQRLLARCFGVVGFPGTAAVQRRLWALAEALVPGHDVEAYTQGLMDLGATRCTRGRPRCQECPLAERCVALREGRTAELPTPRPRRALPRKTAWMLVLRDAAGRVLLERRPGAGIWGGLWSLPQLEAVAALDGWLAAASLGADSEPVPLPAIAHTFTHFHVDIRPLALRVAPAAGVQDDAGRVWLAPADALARGLPAPVRTLLAALATDAAMAGRDAS